MFSFIAAYSVAICLRALLAKRGHDLALQSDVASLAPRSSQDDPAVHRDHLAEFWSDVEDATSSDSDFDLSL